MIPRVFFFTDGERGLAGRPLVRVIQELVAGGVDGIVLREFERSGSELLDVIDALQGVRQAGARLLLSRRLDLARAGACDGVHLAADSIAIAEARRFLGPEALIGYSAHSQEEAHGAARAGANYVSLSPIYSTQSKPRLPGRGLSWLAQACQDLEVPVLALGGVTPARTDGILSSGAWGVAAVSALGAADDLRRAARAFRAAIEETESTCA